jgi:hypothetical protein
MLAGQSAFAEALPASLLYKGKPIAPYCLEGLLGEKDGISIDLGQCNIDQITLEKGEAMEQKNTYSAYWSMKDEPPDLFLHYSLGYDYIGMQDDDPVLHISYWGGGSGNFSYLMRLHREGDELTKLETIAAGDGCTGGIIANDPEHPLTIEDNEIHFSAAFSPDDMFHIAGETDWYELYSRQGGLAGTHHDCYGIASYVGEKLVSVEFSGYMASGLAGKEKPPSKPDLQYCLDQMVDKHYIAKDKLVLSVSELHQLIEGFRKECITAP